MPIINKNLSVNQKEESVEQKRERFLRVRDDAVSALMDEVLLPANFTPPDKASETAAASTKKIAELEEK